MIALTLLIAGALTTHPVTQITSHYDTLLPTNDRNEGINAFNEKRKPCFTGE